MSGLHSLGDVSVPEPDKGRVCSFISKRPHFGGSESTLFTSSDWDDFLPDRTVGNEEEM